jgi:hypothetical protein
MLVEQVLFARETAPSQGIYINGTASVGAAVAWIRYEGAVGSGATLTIDATYGDLVFTTDGTIADTTVLESGGTGGTIDVSDANGNTLGEVVDAVNASDNWAMVLLAGERSDISTNNFIAVAEVDMSTAAMKKTGLFLFQDPQVAPQTSLYGIAHAISAFDPANYAKGDDPDEGCISVVTYVNATADFTTSASIKFVNANLDGSEVCATIALADNTAKELGNLAAPIWRSKVGHRLIVRVLGTESVTGSSNAATKMTVAGYTIDLTGKKNPCNSYSITNASG